MVLPSDYVSFAPYKDVIEIVDTILYGKKLENPIKLNIDKTKYSKIIFFFFELAKCIISYYVWVV